MIVNRPWGSSRRKIFWARASTLSFAKQRSVTRHGRPGKAQRRDRRPCEGAQDADAGDCRAVSSQHLIDFTDRYPTRRTRQGPRPEKGAGSEQADRTRDAVDACLPRRSALTINACVRFWQRRAFTQCAHRMVGTGISGGAHPAAGLRQLGHSASAIAAKLSRLQTRSRQWRLTWV